MTKDQILSEIAKYEKGLTNTAIPEAAKEKFKKNIEELKAKLEQEEKKAEQQQEKTEKQESKEQQQLEQEIAKYEKGLANPAIPEVAKEKFKNSIKELKEKLADLKKEAKEDKKEAQQETKEIKEAIKKVDKVVKEVEKEEKRVKREKPIKRKTGAKRGRPASAEKKTVKVKPKRIKASGATKKVKVKETQRKVKAARRKVKIKSMLSQLQKLVKQNKSLREKYQKDVKKNKIDLERDAKRPAKPFGYRFRGVDYRDPKKVLTQKQFENAKKRGILDYENRPNRSDKYPKGYTGAIGKPKLAHGGEIDDKIKTIKMALNNPNLPSNAKEALKSKLAKLESMKKK